MTLTQVLPLIGTVSGIGGLVLGIINFCGIGLSYKVKWDMRGSRE
jgi:hypothetical protein